MKSHSSFWTEESVYLSYLNKSLHFLIQLLNHTLSLISRNLPYILCNGEVSQSICEIVHHYWHIAQVAYQHTVHWGSGTPVSRDRTLSHHCCLGDYK